MEPSHSGEIAFFQIAATLIPLLLFSGVVAERTASLHGLPRHVGLRTGVIAALVLGGLGITAEIISLRAMIRGAAKPFWLDFVSAVLVLSLTLVIGFAIWAWIGKVAEAKRAQTSKPTPEPSLSPPEPSLEMKVLGAVSAVVLLVGTVLGTVWILRSADSSHHTEASEKGLDKMGSDGSLEIRLLEGDLNRVTARQMRMFALVRSDDRAIAAIDEKMRLLRQGGHDTHDLLTMAHRRWGEAAHLRSDLRIEERMTEKAHVLAGKLSSERTTLRGLGTQREELIDHEGA